MELSETLYPQGNFLNIKANAPTQKDYNIQATKDLVENLPGGAVKDFLAPAAAATLSLPYDAIQAYGRMKPESGIMGFKDAFMAENPFSSLVERTMGAAGPLAERFDDVNEDDDEYDFSGIEGQTAMLGLPQLFGMITKGGFTKKAIQKALIQNQISGQIGKRVRPHLVKTLRQKLLGEKFGGSGKFKNISTSNKNYGPYTQPTSKPTYTPPARPHGGGGARPDKPGGFTDPGKGSYGPHMAYGGRASYFDGGLLSLWPR